eukprot:3262587-Pyramimonas_sp.AAC.1
MGLAHGAAQLAFRKNAKIKSATPPVPRTAHAQALPPDDAGSHDDVRQLLGVLGRVQDDFDDVVLRGAHAVQALRPKHLVNLGEVLLDLGRAGPEHGQAVDPFPDGVRRVRRRHGLA